MCRGGSHILLSVHTERSWSVYFRWAWIAVFSPIQSRYSGWDIIALDIGNGIQQPTASVFFTYYFLCVSILIFKIKSLVRLILQLQWTTGLHIQEVLLLPHIVRMNTYDYTRCVSSRWRWSCTDPDQNLNKRYHVRFRASFHVFQMSLVGNGSLKPYVWFSHKWAIQKDRHWRDLSANGTTISQCMTYYSSLFSDLSGESQHLVASDICLYLPRKLGFNVSWVSQTLHKLRVSKAPKLL